MQLSALYTKEYPAVAELEAMSTADLQAFAKGLEEDVGLLDEETRIFGAYLKTQKDKEAAKDDEGEEDNLQATANSSPVGGGKRRGRAYRRKSSDHKDLILSVDDKQVVAVAEQDRLKLEKDRNARLAEDARDLVNATIEEAQNRIKEVKLEMAYFKREVVNDKDVSADKILKYFADRPANKEQYVRKLRDKCTVLQQQISKSLQQLKQREDVGEAFHTIDFDQLKIENHQFNERIEQKNLELVELKGTTTRTVQALNSLTDKLNALTAEQAQLRKELKSRQEYVSKVTAEIEQVQKEAGGAQRKNTALKLQHEAVKVPKVEDYIAQKAEMYELEKAAQNWRRKVEIAAGHVAVMKQQILALRKAESAVASMKRSGR